VTPPSALAHLATDASRLWGDPARWARLAERILPALAAGGSLRAWSPGCAAGADAYTLAATCRQVAPRARIEIVATDADAALVARARLGHFVDEAARTAPADALSKHFARTADGWEATAALKAIVRFEVGTAPPAEPFDLVLCRTPADARHLAVAVRPGGHLFLTGGPR
jgi:chemotaxis methyl-accepting protein methylase